MKKIKLLPLIGSIVLMTGCASGLNSAQEHEYNEMKASGVLVEEKNPNTCAWFGILPGGGSFCARHPGLGIVNLLFWPLSIAWDPISGYDGAQTINYDMTKHAVKKKKETEEQLLDDKLASGEVDMQKYTLEKRKINSKYDYE